MNAIFFLNACNPTFWIFTLSIFIDPPSISTSLYNAYKIEDLPAPVLPTIPTFIYY